MYDTDETKAASSKEIGDRHTVCDRTIDVLIREVVEKVMEENPGMSTGDAAVGILNGSIFVASRLPGVGWHEVSRFLKAITEAIDSRTEAEIEAHYKSSAPLN